MPGDDPIPISNLVRSDFGCQAPFGTVFSLPRVLDIPISNGNLIKKKKNSTLEKYKPYREQISNG